MINQTDIPIMKKAVKVIYDMSEDTKIREVARLREKALHDEASALKNAKAEGISIGKAEGISIGKNEGKNEERANLIANMKALGMTDEQINQIIFYNK